MTFSCVFCVGLKLSPVETLKQIQNAPADRANGTELDLDLLGFSLPPHLTYSPDLASLDFHLLPDLTKNLNIVQRCEMSLELRNKAHEVFFFSFNADFFKLKLKTNGYIDIKRV